ncbi:hypothetical protein [Microbacterium sp. 16-032]|uniref:hypothetical protein n=1 Tax=Microbacterium sp. 16-032 TaxID=3239808 RepID=UPI0034E1AB00
MAWKNGYIPESDLVIFNRGWNDTDGNWYWGLTPATYARHLALVDRAHDRTGRWLSPGDGWSTVRPMAGQQIARRLFGNGAAAPGTSSHGGFWEGRETLAVDYSNWAWVYSGDRAAFYADCRAVGLSPGMIEPSRGYPDEPWHVIDLNPRGPVPASSNAKPFEEEDDMPYTPEQIKQMTKDGLFEFFRDVNTGPAEGQRWAFADVIAAQMWSHLITAQDGAGNEIRDAVGTPIQYTAAGYVASTNARVGGTPAAVDAQALASMLAPLLAPLIQNVGALTDEQVRGIAKAASDEIDRRQRERLAS